ncbi:MAG: hypothetical protein HQL94_09690 [Magnetococcales bacterium]|nr:hypothetical protein [Magnetococcales bacterium]
MQPPVAIPDDVAEPLTGESKTKILTREQARDMKYENSDWMDVEDAILKFLDLEVEEGDDPNIPFHYDFGSRKACEIYYFIHHEMNQFDLLKNEDDGDKVSTWFRKKDVGSIVYLPEFVLLLVRKRHMPGNLFIDYCKKDRICQFNDIKLPKISKEFFLRAQYLLEEKSIWDSDRSSLERKTSQESMQRINQELKKIGATPFDESEESNVAPTGQESSNNPSKSNATSNIRSETACQKWLISIMGGDDNKYNNDAKSTKTKKDYYADAKAQPGVTNLSWRSFERAWRNAIEKTGAEAFSKPGRKS